MIKRISKQDYLDLLEFSSSCPDIYQDFYITLNNGRKFFNDFDTVKFYFSKLNFGEIGFNSDKGYLLTWGNFGKSNRRFIKLLVKDLDAARDLLTIFLYKFGNKDFYAKLKKNNPIVKIMLSKGFIFSGDRGLEVLLYRKGIPIPKIIREEE